MAKVANPLAHPFGPPTISGANITVDMALQQPTRITQMVMDLTLQRFIADRVFSGGGGVTGGSVIYDQVQANEIYTNRDVQRISPGQAFPTLTSERYTPKTAEVEKWGGKVFVTKEARDRNEVGVFAKEVRQLANTIVRKINQRAVEVIEEEITASSRSVAGNNWSTAITSEDTQIAQRYKPQRDFANLQYLANTDELGIEYDLWLVNPQELLNLQSIYSGDLDAVLARLGIELFASNRVTAGTAYVIAMGQVGEMRNEEPMMTESWYDEEHQVYWVQTAVKPVFFVTNPFALYKVTGLA